VLVVRLGPCEADRQRIDGCGAGTPLAAARVWVFGGWIVRVATDPMLEIRRLPAVSQADLDALFAGNPDPFGIEPLRLQTRAKDLHFILALDGQAASHVSLLLSHTLRVGTLGVPVGGIGGVITRPDVRRRGFAARLLGHTLSHLRTQSASEFAFLFCLPRLLGYYRSLGWEEIREDVYIEQPGGEILSPLCSMAISLRDHTWPPGRVHLGSLPW
jgi:GNAT superfamily N-acetyltransferase